jgi:hypothetical protein
MTMNIFKSACTLQASFSLTAVINPLMLVITLFSKGNNNKLANSMVVAILACFKKHKYLNVFPWISCQLTYFFSPFISCYDDSDLTNRILIKKFVNETLQQLKKKNKSY